MLTWYVAKLCIPCIQCGKHNVKQLSCPVRHFGLHAREYKLLTAGYRLNSTDYRLRINSTDHTIQTTDYRPQSPEYTVMCTKCQRLWCESNGHQPHPTTWCVVTYGMVWHCLCHGLFYCVWYGTAQSSHLHRSRISAGCLGHNWFTEIPAAARFMEFRWW